MVRDVTPLLVVDDVRATVDYYVRKLGFTEEFIYSPETPVFAAVKYQDVRFLFETVTSYNSKGGVKVQGGPRGMGIDLNVILSGDIDQYYAKVMAAGVAVIRPVFTTDYGMRQFTIRDLSGYVLTFICHCSA